jgi:hypothetical protein
MRSFPRSNIPVMTSSSLKSRVCRPSKHFFMCGWTLVGSLVSERISSISSFERKKKRGKRMRLDSR